MPGLGESVTQFTIALQAANRKEAWHVLRRRALPKFVYALQKSAIAAFST